MKDYSQIAVENFENGYNCAQSVFLSYVQDFGIDKEMALKLSSSFGGGMGRLREVCGAVTAMFAIAGLQKGYTSNDDDEVKAKHYELIQKLAEEFKKEHHTLISRELLELNEQISSPIPSKRTEEYYQERPCARFIETACKLISKEL